MLNPSVADEDADDRTVDACVEFSRRHGADRLTIANLYAFRTTDPRQLEACSDPVGPDNDWQIEMVAAEAEAIVVAWGSFHPARRMDHRQRVRKVLGILPNPLCLGVNKDGSPFHPQRRPRDLLLQPYRAHGDNVPS